MATNIHSKLSIELAKTGWIVIFYYILALLVIIASFGSNISLISLIVLFYGIYVSLTPDNY